jgi:hypothetical protein
MNIETEYNLKYGNSEKFGMRETYFIEDIAEAPEILLLSNKDMVEELAECVKQAIIAKPHKYISILAGEYWEEQENGENQKKISKVFTIRLPVNTGDVQKEIDKFLKAKKIKPSKLKDQQNYDRK